MALLECIRCFSQPGHRQAGVSAGYKLTPAHQDSLVEMRVEGERTPLRPSTSHPFWVRRGDASPAWMRASQMRVEDFVQSQQGDWRRVVATTPVEGQETVYNFSVDKDHDYFVGQTGFLVHNAGGRPCGLRFTDRMSKNGLRNLVNDIRNNGLMNKVINYVAIAGENYVVLGNNRMMAANQIPGLPDQLEYEEVQLPFRGFQTEEDVINAAADFQGGCGCSY
jgi:hypothetical protein